MSKTTQVSWCAASFVLALVGSGCSSGTSDEFDDERGTIGGGSADGGGGEGGDAGEPDVVDAGALDAGDVQDAGALDAGDALDAGALDAGDALDAGALDAGDALDAGALDAGDALDAGALDAGALDAGALDAGDALADGGSLDAGASVRDAGARDAGSEDDSGPGTEIVQDGGVVGCDFGSAQSVAGADTVNLFGAVVYFANETALPAGNYRVIYEDGCMKYGLRQDWAVHAYAGGSLGWWLVGENTGDRRVVLPGTVGYMAGQGGFAEFEACVAANGALAPVSFVHPGGKLGVWLLDSPYTDNVTGEGGRNPRWRLERLGAGCEPTPDS